MATRKQGLRTGLANRVEKKTSLALFGLFGFFTLAVVAGLLATPRYTVFAASTAKGSEPWLELNCLENVVEEGDDFRLVVYKKFDSDWPHRTMRVFWYTEPITADESDYERLYAERQASNEYQSEHGRMGRDFHTLEDLYPEVDERFEVRFNNSEDHGHDGSCIITIKDDDGVGIYALKITSDPGEVPSESENGEAVTGYVTGDVIEITARFTGDVTNVNPDTREQVDYAGIRIQVGENRRVARLLRGAGTDTLVFGYTVREDDLDTDGISVEPGGPRFPARLYDQFTGFRFNRENFDIGLWPMSEDHESVNRFYHGLSDDPEHAVVPVAVEEPDDTFVQPSPEAPVTGAVSLPAGQLTTIDGELTAEDEGRDWYSFDATGGESYIIELRNMLEFVEDGGNSRLGLHVRYVDGHLADPSILEVVDSEGKQALGEHDEGGFTGNFARAFFTPEENGTYYIAVGAGREDRDGTGFYTLSVRADDHADDHKVNAGVALLPGQGFTGRIDSDVAPDDPRLNPWDWGVHDGKGVPIFGLESLDDRDVFRVEVTEETKYVLAVRDAPSTIGIWGIWREGAILHGYTEDGPVSEIIDTLSPGTYYVDVGTSYESEGATGTYTFFVAYLPD